MKYNKPTIDVMNLQPEEMVATNCTKNSNANTVPICTITNNGIQGGSGNVIPSSITPNVDIF